MSENSLHCPTSVDELDDVISRPDQDLIARFDQLEGDCLVLGAGGKMGYHLARMLQKVNLKNRNPGKVIAVSRFTNPQAQARFEKDAITTIRADLGDQKSVISLPDARNVFFLAGVKFGTSNHPDLLWQMNQEMPLRVAQRFSDSKIVAMSTGCVYAFSDAESGGSKETDRLSPPGEYAKSCIAREQAFERVATNDGTAVTIVRLNYSIDLRYGVLLDIAKAIQKNEPIDLSTGYVNVIWQRDAISQILRCLMLTTSPARIINVTGSETLSVRWIAERFAEKMRRPVTFVGTESSKCWLSNNSQARARFGEPLVSVEQMIDWVFDWLSRDMPTLSKPTQFQIRDGNY